MKLFGKIAYLLILAFVAIFFQIVLIYFMKDKYIFYFLLLIPIILAMKFYEYLLLSRLSRLKRFKGCLMIVILGMIIIGIIFLPKKEKQCDYFWNNPFFVEKMPKELSDTCKDVFVAKLEKIETEIDQ